MAPRQLGVRVTDQGGVVPAPVQIASNDGLQMGEDRGWVALIREVLIRETLIRETLIREALIREALILMDPM